MSVRLMTAVWDLDLPPGEKLVLLALADQANDQGTQCWPSVATIAKRSGQGERTVRRALADLEGKGHLTRDHRDGASTQYRVHPCVNPLRRVEYHYVYRTSDPLTGEFYVGARSCTCEIVDDSYTGSGVWVTEAERAGRVLVKDVISVHETRAALGEAESAAIRAVIGLAACMNRVASTPANLAGAKMAGPQPLPKTTGTPAKLAPKPSRTTNPQKATPSSGPRAKPAPKVPAFRMPEDWKPIRFADGTVAREVVDRRGLEWARAALESFRNWAANAEDRDGVGRKHSWQAAWANWVIEQDRRDGRNGQRRNGTDNDNGIGRTERAALSFAGLAEHEAGGPEPAPLRRVGPSGGGTGLVASNPH